MKTKIIHKILLSINSIPFIRDKLFRVSTTYIDIYRGFSYDIKTNGEKDLVNNISNIFSDEIIFFDVGANIGNWTSEAICKFKTYDGHLFEMSVPTYENLIKRCGDNKKLTINNIAISDSDGELEYRDFGENSGVNTLLTNAEYHKKDSIIKKTPVTTGDSYCSKNNISRIHLLKIDTEGAEYSVLSGFKDMLSKGLIDVIQFEYGYTHADSYTLMRDFYNLLESYGYIIGALRKDGVKFKKFSYSDNDFKSGPNYIACLPKHEYQLSKFISSH